jgi:hypothetical protein
MGAGAVFENLELVANGLHFQFQIGIFGRSRRASRLRVSPKRVRAMLIDLGKASHSFPRVRIRFAREDSYNLRVLSEDNAKHDGF